MWVKKTVEEFENDIVKKVKGVFERWAAVEVSVVEAKMPSLWVAWSEDCNKAIATLNGAARNMLAEIDDQIEAFLDDRPSDIEKNKLKNAKAKAKKSAPKPVKKPRK